MDELYINHSITNGTAFLHKINGEVFDHRLKPTDKVIDESYTHVCTFLSHHQFESEAMYVITAAGGWAIICSDDVTFIIKACSSKEVKDQPVLHWFPLTIPKLTSEPMKEKGVVTEHWKLSLRSFDGLIWLQNADKPLEHAAIQLYDDVPVNLTDEIYIETSEKKGEVYHKIGDKFYDWWLLEIESPAAELTKLVTIRHTDIFTSGLFYVVTSAPAAPAVGGAEAGAEEGWFICTYFDHLTIKYWSSPAVLNQTCKTWGKVPIANLFKSPILTGYNRIMYPHRKLTHLSIEREFMSLRHGPLITRRKFSVDLVK